MLILTRRMPVSFTMDTQVGLFRRFPSPEDRPRAEQEQCTTGFGTSKAKIGQFYDDSRFPGQFGLLIQTLAVEMFEVVRINLMAEAGVGFRDQANWPGCWNRFGWSTGGWVVPEAAMLEDFADGIALAGFNEGDDFHGGGKGSGIIGAKHP